MLVEKILRKPARLRFLIVMNVLIEEKLEIMRWRGLQDASLGYHITCTRMLEVIS